MQPLQCLSKCLHTTQQFSADSFPWSRNAIASLCLFHGLLLRQRHAYCPRCIGQRVVEGSRSPRRVKMKVAARKSYNLLSKSIGDLRDSFTTQKQQPTVQTSNVSFTRKYPAELQIGRPGEELLEVNTRGAFVAQCLLHFASSHSFCSRRTQTSTGNLH